MTTRQLGIEEEFLLFRQDAPELFDGGPEVVAAADRSSDEDAQFEKELKAAQVELATQPDTRLEAVAVELSQRRAELAAAAAERGARLVATGTSPVGDDSTTTPNARYREMERDFGVVQRRQLTSAMHVHVSIESDDEGVAVVNGLARWLPALSALAANSPFHEGRDTGYASFRRVQWGQWPTAGATGRFADGRDYRRTVDALVATGAARDPGMIYFDARLSANYPTVEVRVCDVSIDATTAVALAALIRGIVESVVRTGADDVPRPELLQAAHWRAARYGLSGDLVDLGVDLRADAAPEPSALLVPAAKVIDDLLAFVQPALDDAGDTDTVRGELDRLRTEGTGAQRQRAVVAATGDVAAAVDAATVRP